MDAGAVEPPRQLALALGVEEDAARGAEERGDGGQERVSFRVQARLEQRAAGDEGQAAERRAVKIRDEEEGAEAPAFGAQVFEQGRRVDVVLDESARVLVGDGADAGPQVLRADGEQPRVGGVERGGVARVGGEAADVDAVFVGRAGRVLVRRPVVGERAAAGGEDFDGVPARGEAQGYRSRLPLGPAVERGAEPRGDDGELAHTSSPAARRAPATDARNSSTRA
ncbi:MAG: hypothetical protein LC800_09820 [Acidobacteria bacterium]|nr:hypothetical protein [Acidobacteriota bacterium]